MKILRVQQFVEVENFMAFPEYFMFDEKSLC